MQNLTSAMIPLKPGVRAGRNFSNVGRFSGEGLEVRGGWRCCCGNVVKFMEGFVEVDFGFRMPLVCLLARIME